MSISKDRERLVDAQLEALRAHAQTSTEFLGRLGGQLVNDTLEVATLVIPASGVLTRSYGVSAGAVRVRNLSNDTAVTVVAGGPGAAAPTQGTGVAIIPAGEVDTVPLAARQWTLYGSDGDTVCVQVFTSGVRPVTP